jgi:hypothetical protein
MIMNERVMTRKETIMGSLKILPRHLPGETEENHE